MTTYDPVGPYTAGERPEMLSVSYQDANGAPVNLSGFTVKVTYRVDDGAQVVRDGVLIDGPGGEAGYLWTSADWATAGLMTGEVTVGNGGGQRYTRSFQAVILPPRGGPVPQI